MKDHQYYSKAQLHAEINRCENCQEKPCRDACPVHCSPADFIQAARLGGKSDYLRSALNILSYNPLGQVCGIICPDTFCMTACSRKKFDNPVEIPKIQASVCQFARQNHDLKAPARPVSNNKKVAIIGAGPAGLGASAFLSRLGYKITLFDKANAAGGACLGIPDFRFPKESLQADVDFVLSLGEIETRFGTAVDDPELLLSSGYDAVLVAIGEPDIKPLGIPGEDLSVSSIEFLKEPSRYIRPGAKVAVIGGGAVAADCATTAQRLKAASVEMFVRRTYNDMRLTGFERELLMDHGIDITTRTRLEAIYGDAAGKLSLQVVKTEPGPAARPGVISLQDIAGTSVKRPGFDCVIMALGTLWQGARNRNNQLYYAGDCILGSGTVVEAVASGKNAAWRIHARLNGEAVPENLDEPGTYSTCKSTVEILQVMTLPVSLETDFFGFPLSSPFILSAAPHTDGFEQVKQAYEAGWAGAVMKTAFDNLPIHIPGAYMYTFDEDTYGNCDNVSGHALDRVCAEIVRLRQLFPDRLTMGSTGGPVTGDDENDKKVWQSNTQKLERAGACAVEYSLSCPQGGDGTEGNIVSQNPALTAKVIDWVMQISDPNVPKLFKLTGAVTSIKPVMKAIQETLARYPHKKAGVTLANSFPVMAFRQPEKSANEKWDQGVIYGMSGKGVLPMSFNTLADASSFGVTISGNGGVMSYLDAANFLALGARTVQVCTVVMKYGLNVIDELNCGLSFFMQERGISSVSQLIGKALPEPVTGFVDLSATKKVSALTEDLCTSCGNCVRGCGYQALSLNGTGKPLTDPSRCIGCSICAKTCFAGALFMRERTKEETIALVEEEERAEREAIAWRQALC